MRTALFYILAAFAEIAGCFSAWAYFRQGASAFWLLPGLASLATFAVLLTFVDSTAAGRAFAAYGGIYIAASLVWLRAVDRVGLDRWDMIGAALCLTGACVIILGPRAA